jgi:cell division protein FtsI/penicillin-binding protein 2
MVPLRRDRGNRAARLPGRPRGRARRRVRRRVNESQLAKIADGSLQQGDIVGKTGVEREYDEILRGRRGWRLQTVNSLGRPFGASQPGRDPTDGLPLHLTIDKRLQRKLVEALADEVGSGIFMDPHTGEVLALASTPGYDPISSRPPSRARRGPR